jgi:hypothetical protein
MEDNETQSEGIVKEKGDRQKAMSELGICKLTAACTVKSSTCFLSHILYGVGFKDFFQAKICFLYFR